MTCPLTHPSLLHLRPDEPSDPERKRHTCEEQRATSDSLRDSQFSRTRKLRMASFGSLKRGRYPYRPAAPKGDAYRETANRCDNVQKRPFDNDCWLNTERSSLGQQAQLSWRHQPYQLAVQRWHGFNDIEATDASFPEVYREATVALHYPCRQLAQIRLVPDQPG